MQPKALIAAVQNISGGSFIGLDTVTTVTLTGGKKNPMQGRVTKRMTGATVMAFTHEKNNAYEAMVKRRLAAEGRDPATFEVKDRKWGTRLPNLPIVVHNKDGVDKYYLEVIFIRPGQTEYELDGVSIAKDDIEGLPVERVASGQADLENMVIIRDFTADSITELRIDGKAHH